MRGGDSPNNDFGFLADQLMSYMLVKLSGGRFNFDQETKFSVLHIVRDTCVDIRESVDLMLLPFTGCYYCHRIIYSSGGWWWRVRAHWTWGLCD